MRWPGWAKDLRRYSAAIWAEAWPGLEKGDLLIVITISIFVGLGAFGLGQGIDNGQAAAFGILAWLLLFIGFVAPFRVWQRQDNKITELTTPVLAIEPLVRQGSGTNGPTFYVVAVVKNLRKLPVKNVRGNLVAVEMTNPDPQLAAFAENIQPGFLQWSSRYGGGETTTIADEADLDVLAFDGIEGLGIVVYASDMIRSLKEAKVYLPDPANGDLRVLITIEVYPEDQPATRCTFRLCKGGEGRTESARHPMYGTLYAPESAP